MLTDTHARSMSEVEISQCAQSPALSLVVQPALRREVRCVRKETFIATNSVQIRLTVRLYVQRVTLHYILHYIRVT